MGQDGYYLSKQLIQMGYEVHGMARRTTRSEDRMDALIKELSLVSGGNFYPHFGDVTDPASVTNLIASYQPHVVFNLASISFVPASWENPGLVLETNAQGPINILEAIRTTSKHTRLVQASTSEMFGVPTTEFKTLNEDSPMKPRSIYGVSKLVAHHACEIYRQSYGIHASSMIMFNHESIPPTIPVIVRDHEDLIDVVPIADLIPTPDVAISGLEVVRSGLNTDIWDGENWTAVVSGTAYYTNNRNLITVFSRSGVVKTTSEHVFFMRDGEVPARDINFRNHTQEMRFPDLPEVVRTVSPDEAWVWGFIVGDGSVSKGGKISAGGSDKSLIDKWWERYQKVRPGVSGRMWQTPHGGFLTSRKPLWAMHPLDAEYGRKLRPMMYTFDKQKRVPKEIFNAPREVKIAFLRGYNAADGLKAGHGNYEFKSWGTTSHTLMMGLWLLADSCLAQRVILTHYHAMRPKYFRLNLNSPSTFGKHSSLPHGDGAHLRKSTTEVRKVATHPYSGWLYDLQTGSQSFMAGGRIRIHNSPRRPARFVTRKITRWAALTALGHETPLQLGNIETQRDWGHAEDYVRAMRMAADREEPGDYVIASGRSRMLKEFITAACTAAKIDYPEIKITESLKRPWDVPFLAGDATRAREELGWYPEMTFDDLVSEMVKHDMETVLYGE